MMAWAVKTIHIRYLLHQIINSTWDVAVRHHPGDHQCKARGLVVIAITGYALIARPTDFSVQCPS